MTFFISSHENKFRPWKVAQIQLTAMPSFTVQSSDPHVVLRKREHWITEHSCDKQLLESGLKFTVFRSYSHCKHIHYGYSYWGRERRRKAENIIYQKVHFCITAVGVHIGAMVTIRVTCVKVCYKESIPNNILLSLQDALGLMWPITISMNRIIGFQNSWPNKNKERTMIKKIYGPVCWV